MPVSTTEEDAAQWVTLIEAEPELAFRMLLVRRMLEQRGINIPQVLAPHLSITRQRINQALHPRSVNIHIQSVASAHRLLDRIEDAITELSVVPEAPDVANEVERINVEELMTRAHFTERRW